MKHLQLAKDLTLPADAVTQTFAIFGKRGSGKTNGATVLVEELLKAHLPVVILDPVDAWWGLKASFDGKGPGFPVYVFGGSHGDLPLEPSAGALTADLVAHERLPLVLSMKMWGVAERARFVTDFAKRLLQVNTEPVMMVLEEADAFIPQRPGKGEEAMLGAMDRLVRWGRQSGVGCTIVTQRSAKVNKDVTTQAETLIAFRTTGPQDRDAIDAWIKYHAGDEQRDEVLSTLPTLANGTAWVWSPEWLGVLQKVAVRRRATFDSAATPKVGQKTTQPKKLASVDLERLRTQMAETVEKAKADDPRELRKTIAELKRELVSKQATGGNKQPAVLDTAKRDALEKRQRENIVKLQKVAAANLERIFTHLHDHAEAQMFRWTAQEQKAKEWLATLRGIVIDQQAPATMPTLKPQREWPPPAHVAPRRSFDPPAGDVKLNRLAERKVLQVLAVHGPRTKRQLAIQAGYAASGGGFLGALSKLKGAGFLTTNGSGTLVITTDGQAAIGDVEPLPTGEALVAYWMQQFKRLAEREVLRVIVAAYPKALAADEIATRTTPPYEPTGGGFLGAVSKLRTLGLIEGRGDLRASDDLFS